jgi:hypothetical protein
MSTAIIIDNKGNVWCGPIWKWWPLEIAQSENDPVRPNWPIVVYDSAQQAEKQAMRLRKRAAGGIFGGRLVLGEAREIAVVSGE